MSKLPLILTIVALLCATGLGIAAKKRADLKVKELADTHSELKSTQGTLATRTGELGKANDRIAAADKEIEAKGAEVAKLDGDLKTKASELAEATEVAKKLEEKANTSAAEAKEAIAKLAAADALRAAAEAQLADAQKATAEVKVAYDQIKQRLEEKERVAAASSPVSSPTQRTALRSGTIVAVNSGLNYVVLSVGDQQGVSVNTALVVLRGGQRVATLKVTSIEPRASVAEVVPGTLAKGQAVQVGDRVVPAGAGERKTSAPSAIPASAPVKVGRTSQGGNVAERAVAGLPRA